MPAQPRWLLRVPEIIEELSAIDAPVVDRAAAERLFRVRRRQAIHLLETFGGYQAGKTFLVERETLIARLRAIAAGEPFRFEKLRREKLLDAIERVRKHRKAARISIPVEPGAAGAAAPQLPDGVTLEPGRLTVEFTGAQELLGKLYGVAQAAAADFERFQAAAGDMPETPPQPRSTVMPR